MSTDVEIFLKNPDRWGKKIIKCSDPEKMSELIKDRIEKPLTYGPFCTYYVNSSNPDKATDILRDLALKKDGFERKISLGTGTLLHSLIENNSTNHSLLRGVFNLIEEAKLTLVSNVVFAWVKKYLPVLVAPTKEWIETYKSALLALSATQSKDDQIEFFWVNMFDSGPKEFWNISFSALRKQNPFKAISFFPLMTNRKMKHMDLHLRLLWSNHETKNCIETNIANWIALNTKCGGIILNELILKLTENDKKQLLSNLKEKFK